MKGLYRIRASAGSGKTHRLTGQFLEMLAGLNPSAPGRGAACALADAEGTGRSWAEVMGVTFTNAAAQEMKERVLSSLKKIALGLERNPENLHGWTRESALPAVDELLRHYDELNLRTIDSLLHLVVRQSALELELPPDFETTFDNEELFGQLVEDMADRAREAGRKAICTRPLSRPAGRNLPTAMCRVFWPGSGYAGALPNSLPGCFPWWMKARRIFWKHCCGRPLPPPCRNGWTRC